LILYGCGDLISDYEGIRGYEEFRGDLSLLYLVTVDREGRLVNAKFVPMQIRQFQLHHASAWDSAWLCSLLNRLGEPFGTRLELTEDKNLTFG
jgi:poly-gamma-glutamate synthesis protein (capsule biosynthesis protein)